MFIFKPSTLTHTRKMFLIMRSRWSFQFALRDKLYRPLANYWNSLSSFFSYTHAHTRTHTHIYIWGGVFAWILWCVNRSDFIYLWTLYVDSKFYGCKDRCYIYIFVLMYVYIGRNGWMNIHVGETIFLWMLLLPHHPPPQQPLYYFLCTHISLCTF